MTHHDGRTHVMPVLPEVHEALARAVAAGPVRRTRRRPSRRAGLLGLGAVVISGTAVAATGSWHPIIGSDVGHPTRAADTPVPAGQVAALGVLRRPQNDGDRGPEARTILRFLARDEINGVHLKGIRVLARHHGGATVLVPVERIGRHDPGYPSTIRRQVLCLFVSQDLNLPTSGTGTADGRSRPARPPAQFSAGSACGDLQKLRTTGIVEQTPAPGGPGVVPAPIDLSTFPPFRLSGLVPDGVATVKVQVRGRTVTAPVHDNLYEIDLGGAGPVSGLDTVWLDAQGNVVNRIDLHER